MCHLRKTIESNIWVLVAQHDVEKKLPFILYKVLWHDDRKSSIEDGSHRRAICIAFNMFKVPTAKPLQSTELSADDVPKTVRKTSVEVGSWTRRSRDTSEHSLKGIVIRKVSGQLVMQAASSVRVTCMGEKSCLATEDLLTRHSKRQEIKYKFPPLASSYRTDLCLRETSAIFACCVHLGVDSTPRTAATA